MKLSYGLLVKGALVSLFVTGSAAGGFLKGTDSKSHRKGRYLKARRAEDAAEGYIIKCFDGSKIECDALIGTLPEGATVGHVFEGSLIGFDGFSVHDISEADVLDLVDNNDAVSVASQNAKTYPTSVQSWGQDRVDQQSLPLDNSFNPPYDGSGVDVYIFDNGMRPDHVEYVDRLIERKDFTSFNDGGYGDHGTHCAGTAVGKTVGVAKNANVYDVRVLGPESGTSEWLIAGIQWAIQNAQTTNRRSVLSMSLGGGLNDDEGTAIQTAVEAGLFVVVAAGNEDSDACTKSPASALAAVTVGASTITDGRADFSNWGSCVQIFAPGVGIKSAVSSSSTAYQSQDWDGTSMSCPHVAGAAALLLQANPLTPAYNVGSGLADIASKNKLSATENGGLKNSPNLLAYVGSITTGMTFPGPSCINREGWKDSGNDGCQWYQDNNACSQAAQWAVNGVGADTACCFCNGGSPGTSYTSGATPTSGTGWRIKTTAAGVARGQGLYWDVRELEFYTSADCSTGKISGGSITVSGTASGSQYVASNAFDGNDSTIWGGRKSGSTFWIGLQGLSDTTVNCAKVNQKNAALLTLQVQFSGIWVDVQTSSGLSDGTTSIVVGSTTTPAPTPLPTPAPVQGGTPTSGTGWRIRATASGVSRGQGQYWDVRELEFYTSPDCTTGKVDISSGTITVSGTASGSQYVGSNAFDGNDSTFWGGRKQGSTFYIGVQGLSEVTVNCVTVNQKNADKIFVDLLSSGSWVEVGEFENLSDGTTDLIVNDSATAAPTPAPVQGGTPTSGTGWRIETTASGVSRGQGQYWDVRELEFYTSPDCTTGKVDISSGTITVSGTASGSQYVASNAFDGNDSTFWGGRKSGSTFWIGMTGLSEVTVNCVTVNQKNADTISVKVLSSGSWVEVGLFENLSDGATDLIVNDSATSAPTPAPVQGGSPTSGTGWRIRATASGVSRGQGQYWDVRELEFYTSPDCTTGKVDISSGTITVSGTASGSQYVASNAFDGNDSTFWGGRKSGSTFYIGMTGLSEVTVNCVTVNQKNADTIFVDLLSSGSWVEVGEFDMLSDGTTDLIVNDSAISAPTPSPVQGGTPTSGTGWRIKTTASGVSRGQGQYWDVNELSFFTSADCINGKVDVSGGTITVSGTASGSQYVASNAFDGNSGSFWGGRKQGSNFWIGVEGLSEVTVKCVVVNQKNADTIAVEVLSSGSWVQVLEFIQLTDGITDLILDSSGTPAPAPTSGTGWRIETTPSGLSRGQGQYWDVFELEFYTSADCMTGKIDSSTGSITVSGTASGSQYVASNAFDGNSGSFWGGRANSGAFWIGLESLSEVSVKCIKVDQKNADTLSIKVKDSGSWVFVGTVTGVNDGIFEIDLS